MTGEQPRRIFLTGFSGTGKSSVARLVADTLGWRTVDTDKLIEEAAGKAVPDVFEKEGEARFRELECEAVRRAASEENVVVATGGGAILAAENRKAMADGGLVICLEASPEVIHQRLQSAEVGSASERPLLAGDDPLSRITELKAARQRIYALADVIIEAGGQSPQETAGAVVAALRPNDPWFSRHPHRLLAPDERDAPPVTDPVLVNAPSRSYPVEVGWGALDRLGELLHEAGLSGAAYVVTDRDVMSRQADRALASLRHAGFEADVFAVPPGEESKSLEAASTIYDWLVAHRAERRHAVIALGGGVVGDLAGFVAATYLRGVPLVQAPTSLLAMVDAAIGGKVAVDHREGKNLIGAFYQPRLVVEDVSTLKTLPKRALVEGCAEVIKHAFILDPRLLADLEARADDLLHVEPAFAVDVVRRNVAIKASIVAADEREADRRAILNYGHTVGHAIEAAAGYSGILHGEAISVGMMAAAEIGRRVGVTPPDLIDRQRAVLGQFGLPTAGAGLSGVKPEVDRVLEAIALDKKVVAGAVQWVLLENVGRTVLRDDVPMDITRSVVAEVLA